MNRICSLLFALFLPALPAVDAEKIDNRDFAIDTCYPTQNEIGLAEARENGRVARERSVRRIKIDERLGGIAEAGGERHRPPLGARVLERGEGLGLHRVSSPS